MSHAESRTKHEFHETPLVLFTALVIIGAGLPAGHFTAWALGMANWRPDRWSAGAGTISLASGLLLSLLHLGKPSRLASALRRTGRSPLSTEVALVLLTCLPAAAALLLPDSNLAGTLLWSLAALASPALLLTIGWVYRLPAQLSWKGTAAVSPILLGMAIGFLSEAAAAADNARFLFAALILLAADAAGFGIRWITTGMEISTGIPAHPAFSRARRRIRMLRLLDVTILPLLLMLAQLPALALIILSLGVFVDRFAFYALAVRETTESEVFRVERLLKEPATKRTDD